MASADFCIARIASSLTPLALSDGQCRPPGIRHTSFIWRDMDLLLLLRLGIGLCFVWQTYPHKSLISIFCSCPPNFVLDFLHPHPHGHKLVFDYLIPPNWLTGDLHSRCCVMSCVQNSAAPDGAALFSRMLQGDQALASSTIQTLNGTLTPYPRSIFASYAPTSLS